MKRDNRIYRAELLTEKEKEAFGNGISAYLAAEREREEEKLKPGKKKKPKSSQRASISKKAASFTQLNILKVNK